VVVTSPQIDAAARRDGATAVEYNSCKEWGFFRSRSGLRAVARAAPFR
jgi:hypothetical protein